MSATVHSTQDLWDTTTCGKQCDALPEADRVLAVGKAPGEYAGECAPCPGCYAWEPR